MTDEEINMTIKESWLKDMVDTHNKYKKLEAENQQLKELLLVCREMLEEYQYYEGDFRIGDNAEISTSLLLKMIDNAIGEKNE